MICKGCGLDHAEFGASAGWPCARVKRLAAARGAVVHAVNTASVVVHNPPAPVVHAVVHATRKRDRHAKTEERRQYKREHERRRRERLRNAVATP